jgi:UDP-N-acetylglucosamine 2-epimerase (non-hydrolysing)
VIHVFLGTKAQYIKTAPLLRLLDARGVPYRLIDSGQHGALSIRLRDELGVRAPDHSLAAGRDIDSIPQAILWALRIGLRLFDRRRLRAEVFGGHGGVCVVHGDTPSTLLATLLARRAGLTVAHLEAGLRSGNLLHPFPEEAIRLLVMRLSGLLFAPDADAVANLARMRVRGEVVPLPGNTVVEALHHDRSGAEAGSGPVIVTMHRVENLNRRERVAQLLDLVARTATERPVRFVTHGPTIQTLRRSGADRRLLGAGVELVELVPHREFVAMLEAAPFVITDGGSIQEECALLGVPTLLWRGATERADGLGHNVVLSRYDPAVVARFLADPAAYRRSSAATGATPSSVVFDRLLEAA